MEETYNSLRGKLSGKLIRISANLSHFNQSEVNFAEKMFYNELALDDECPTSGPGGFYPGRRKRKQYSWFEGSLGQKKTKEGNKLIKIPRVCSCSGTQRKANILLMKIPKKLVDMERKA